MKCPECASTVDDNATVCPECGFSRFGEEAAGADEDAGAGEGNDQLDQHSQQEDRQRSEQPAHGEQQGHQSGSHWQSQFEGGYQQSTGSQDLLSQAKIALAPLPWKKGAIAGGLVSVGGLMTMWGVASLLVSAKTGAVATSLFTGLLELTPPSRLLSQSLIIFNLEPSAESSVFLSDIAGGRYDAALGALYLLVAWLLYMSGRKLAQWYAVEQTDIVDSVGAGMTVLAGTAPVIGGASLVFGADLADDLLIAGLLVPGILGALGGLSIWIFHDYERLTSWVTGMAAGVLGLLVTFGVTFVWAQGSVSISQEILVRIIAVLITFLNVTLGEFSAGAIGLLAYAGIILPVAGVGYYRAKTDSAGPPTPIEGARAGATLVAGFSVLTFIVIATLAIIRTPEIADWLERYMRVSPIMFFPSSLSSAGRPQLLTLGDFLRSFVISCIVFPVLVGAGGGALGGYLEQEARTRTQAQRGQLQQDQERGQSKQSEQLPQGEPRYSSQDDQPHRSHDRGDQRGQVNQRQAGQPQQVDHPQQPPQGQHPQQPPQGQHPQQPPQGQHPQQPRESDRGFSRRQLLIGGGGVIGGAIGAYLLLSGRGPKETVRQFLIALDNANTVKADSLLHPDGAINSVEPILGPTLDEIDIEIRNLILIDKTRTQAQVRVALTLTDISQDQRRETTSTIYLRKYRGEWRIYRIT